MSFLLQTSKLTKDFGEHKGAFDIDIDLKEGEIVGFIGPNGAGKSTTLSMLSGFIKPTNGVFEIFDQEVDYLNIYKLMPQIGILPSEVAFDSFKTPRQIFTETQKLLKKDLTSNWKEMAGYLDVDLDKKFGELSFGNRKKIGIINALIHKPKLVIMDEPTSGLDPLIQQKFIDILKAIKENGGAILLSSHVLSEVQVACDRIIMIKNGKIILEDKTKDILEKTIKIFKINNLQKHYLEEMEKKNLFEKYEIKGDKTLIYSNKREPILKFLVERGIFDFYLEKPSLEDMFLEEYAN